MSKILVVDDEQAICWGIVKLGQSLGHSVETAASAEEGLRLARDLRPDLLVLDVRLPGMDGLTAMNEFRHCLGDAPMIIITAFGDLETAVKAVQGGAFEYVLKPFELREIRSVMERALHRVPRTDPLAISNDGHQMVGSTPAMQTLFKRIALAADSDANVLVLGESGVGKELAARAVHQYSPRADKPFVAVNVAALSPHLAESELFGHVEGAFTGAAGERKGLLMQADEGTLFLDEVADIPLPLQVKLLRAIEQGEVLPVGSDTPVKTSFRVVAATHQDLLTRVRAGDFRQDLYFRLCAFEIAIPALRDRVEDIPLLACHFLSQFRSGALIFAEETFKELKQRPWHGNVRELRNAIEHACVVAREGAVLPRHLPEPQPCFDMAADFGARQPQLTEASSLRATELLNDPTAFGTVYNRFLDEVERPLLDHAMKHFDNECAPAARALGMHRTTLKKKLEQHKLSAHDNGE